MKEDHNIMLQKMNYNGFFCETFYNINYNYNYVYRHRCKFVTSRRVEGATFAKIPLETISLWLSIRDMFIETDRCEMSPRCIYLNTKMWKPTAITVADKHIGFSRVFIIHDSCLVRRIQQNKFFKRNTDFTKD